MHAGTKILSDRQAVNTPPLRRFGPYQALLGNSMTIQEKLSEFALYAGKWEQSLRAGSLFSFGASRRILQENLIDGHSRLPFCGIFDNNPALWGGYFHGIPVLPPAQATSAPGPVLSLADQAYPAIRRQLLDLGLREFADFMDYGMFLSFYHWHKWKRLVLTAMHAPVTTRCTLNCDACSHLMPDVANPGDVPLPSLVEDLEAIFPHVQRVLYFGIYGGEPLLYGDLPEYLHYISRYRHKIGSLSIITNGTVKPARPVLDICKELDVVMEISDYSAAGLPGYGKRLSALQKLLNANNIRFLVRNFAWTKVYSTTGDLLALPLPRLRQHFSRCDEASACAVLSDKKLLPCQAVWAWIQAGRQPPVTPGDYLDLAALDLRSGDGRELFFHRYWGGSPQGYLSVCRYCYGRDSEFRIPVPTAVQRPRGIRHAAGTSA